MGRTSKRLPAPPRCHPCQCWPGLYPQRLSLSAESGARAGTVPAGRSRAPGLQQRGVGRAEPAGASSRGQSGTRWVQETGDIHSTRHDHSTQNVTCLDTPWLVQHPAGSMGTAPAWTPPGRGTSCCECSSSPDRAQAHTHAPLPLAFNGAHRSPDKPRGQREGVHTGAPQTHSSVWHPAPVGRAAGGVGSAQPRGYSANGLGQRATELGPEHLCSCLVLGAQPGHGQGTRGATAARAPGHCHHQCWDTGALSWSSSRGPGACALMLAKLT